MTRSIRQISFIFAIVAAALIATATTVQAQEEEPIVGYAILGEDIAGPYSIQVQVSPPNPIVGITRVAVRVRDAETDEDLPEVFVRVFGTPADEGERQYSPALNSPADRTFYLSQLDLETAGQWAIDVEVESDLGQGSTVMPVIVQSRVRSGSGNGWGTALFVLISLSFVGGALWLWYSSKQALREREERGQ
ncbi:MAG: hypothetical protein ACO3L6_00955 [Dehalococcoidia bacterium]